MVRLGDLRRGHALEKHNKERLSKHSETDSLEIRHVKKSSDEEKGRGFRRKF